MRVAVTLFKRSGKWYSDGFITLPPECLTSIGGMSLAVPWLYCNVLREKDLPIEGMCSSSKEWLKDGVMLVRGISEEDDIVPHLVGV